MTKWLALLGTSADEIFRSTISPPTQLSQRLYLSVTRGQGEAAQHVIVTLGTDGELGLLDLSSVRHARADLQDAPTEDQKDRRGRSLRREALTDLEYLDGTLLVTGLSNEEFSSKLRRFEFPWSGTAGGTSVEIFHGAHGRWETNAPVRTMTFLEIEGDPHVLGGLHLHSFGQVPGE